MYCPYCGHHLPRALQDGITSCNHCSRVFDSSRLHRLLSAAWLVKRQHIFDVDLMVARYGYKTEDAEFVIGLIHNDGYSHEEFCRHVKQNQSLNLVA